MTPHLEIWKQKYEEQRPRRLLALDGGGILGIMSLEILAEIERQLADMTGEGERFRLGRFFDYVAGTSTGAIIATGLAVGLSVPDLIKFYKESGPAMFQKKWWIQRARAFYGADPLVDKLKHILEDRPLGDPKLQCLLLIVTRNANTDSPWPLSNNPFAKYNDPDRGDNNLNIKLWELVRASTAAPIFFPPEQLEFGDDVTFKFVDGGITAYNNPSFLLYRMATAPEYRLGWSSGEKNMMLISIGTGSAAKVKPFLSDEGDLITKNLQELPSILMSGASVDQDINCRAIGRCVFGTQIDREIGDMIQRKGDPLEGEKIPLEEDLGRAFLYARFDPDVSAAGLKLLGLEGIDPEHMKMDKVEYIEEMSEVGRVYAKNVDMSPFDRFIS